MRRVFLCSGAQPLGASTLTRKSCPQGHDFRVWDPPPLSCSPPFLSNTKTCLDRHIFCVGGISCPSSFTPTAETRPHGHVCAVGVLSLRRTHTKRLHCAFCVFSAPSAPPPLNMKPPCVFSCSAAPLPSDQTPKTVPIWARSLGFGCFPFPADQHGNVPIWARFCVNLLPFVPPTVKHHKCAVSTAHLWCSIISSIPL